MASAWQSVLAAHQRIVDNGGTFPIIIIIYSLPQLAVDEKKKFVNADVPSTTREIQQWLHCEMSDRLSPHTSLALEWEVQDLRLVGDVRKSSHLISTLFFSLETMFCWQQRSAKGFS